MPRAVTGIKSDFLEMAAQMVANNDEVVEEIVVDGDKLAITYYKNRTKEDTETVVIGKEVESETIDGRKVKVGGGGRVRGN